MGMERSKASKGLPYSGLEVLPVCWDEKRVVFLSLFPALCTGEVLAELSSIHTT